MMEKRLLLVFVAVALALATHLTGAQVQRPPTAVPITLPAHGVARSPMIDARADEVIAVQPARSGELVPAIFIYDRERRLIAKNDERAPSADYEWTVQSDGAVQVVLYSNSAQPLDYSIRVLPPAPTRGPEKKTASHAVVPVMFATDRRLESRRPLAFDVEPSAGNEISYGTCYVSIPRDHRMGALESPSIWRLEFSPDPERHIAVVSLELFDRTRFFERVQTLARRSENLDALVFIHGYNVTFDDAARRTAQLAYDLAFKGPAILFSWPSQGTLSGYHKDARNAELSAESLRAILTELSRTPDVKRVHVIAHSMGNRTLVNALTKMGPEASIREIALLAPDIDAELFRRLAREFPRSVGPVTLYASSRDAALVASASLAGYPRAGQGGPGIVVAPNIETIDASSVDTSLAGLRHLYYADTSQILADLFNFFQGTPAAKRFGLKPARSQGRQYWVFAPVVR